MLMYSRVDSLCMYAPSRRGPQIMGVSSSLFPTEDAILRRSFLLAFGVHLNILCVIAQLLLMRQELIDSTSYVVLSRRGLLLMVSPMKILRTFPPLQARAVIGVTVALVKDIPEDVYRELVAHPYQS